MATNHTKTASESPKRPHWKWDEMYLVSEQMLRLPTLLFVQIY